VSCVGGFSEENTLLCWPCISLLVSIVSQINTNSVTYPQMCDFEQLWRRFVKCRELLMALADLYVVGHYAESDFTAHIYYAKSMVPLGSALPIDCQSAALYVQPTLGGKLRTVLQTMLVTVGTSVIRYNSVQFHSHLKQDISYPLFLLCFRTVL